MTIAVGFLCQDGVVIAADRQFTAPGAFKYHEQKFITRQRGEFDLVFVFSGDPGAFAEAHQKIMGCLGTVDDLTTDLIRIAIEEVLQGMGGKALAGDLQLLVAVVPLFDPPQLLVFNGKFLYEARGGVQIVGCGDTSLIRYLGDKLHTPDLTAAHGVALAAYLIKKATQYVDYCGEPIDVILVDGTGTHVIPPEQTTPLVAAMEEQEPHLATLLIRKALP